MQKEIPSSQEKSSRAQRLKDTSRALQSFPLEVPLSEDRWDAATGDLLPDDLDRLKSLAEGFRDRALEGPGEDPTTWLEEARAAVLLWPRDPDWLKETLGLYRRAAWTTPASQDLLKALARRSGRGGVKLPPWLWKVALLLLAVAATIGLTSMLVMGWGKPEGISPVQGPRSLEAIFDTQGVKANIQIAQSRMILFPDATVAELSAWVLFPEKRIEVWEGTVSVLDSAGGVLARREVAFRSSSQGPLEPGQGVEIFEQFDAHPFFDKVTSFLVQTTRILARDTKPETRTEFAWTGADQLTKGFGLRVWLLESTWTDRFASKVHTLGLELENSGLKSFSELQFALVWRDTSGTVLKTLNLRPVSPFRVALPSGGHLGWTQETVFDTEVFSWPKDQPPVPTLELRRWQ